MQKYECICGSIYDPEEGEYQKGIKPGTSFDKLPEDWVCSLCGGEKEFFVKL